MAWEVSGAEAWWAEMSHWILCFSVSHDMTNRRISLGHCHTLLTWWTELSLKPWAKMTLPPLCCVCHSDSQSSKPKSHPCFSVEAPGGQGSLHLWPLKLSFCWKSFVFVWSFFSFLFHIPLPWYWVLKQCAPHSSQVTQTALPTHAQRQVLCGMCGIQPTAATSL